MDRRRFIPSPEGLEGRALLSLFGHSSSTSTSSSNAFFGASTTSTPADNYPYTYKEKEQRIAHLPFYLNELQPGRFLNSDQIAQLQTDLNEIVGELHAPPPKVLDLFNHDLRVALPTRSLSVDSAKTLNHSFGLVLKEAGATPQQTQDLQNDMNDLALVDSHSRNPVYLATNDYALVTQSALQIGRPIARPQLPTLAARDGGHGEKGYGITRNPEPKFNGQYLANATTKAGDPEGIVIQILNENYDVIGQGTVEKSGTYSTYVDQPLSVGVHHIRFRALDPSGKLSLPSPIFSLRVLPPLHARRVVGASVPQGPLGPGTR
ncbi:MAG: hypothetical protein JO252_16110 [Planctomycetaceae bacterium]|nr:hypothetical protein [Planctomycetaceae bacterium]